MFHKPLKEVEGNDQEQWRKTQIWIPGRADYTRREYPTQDVESMPHGISTEEDPCQTSEEKSAGNLNPLPRLWYPSRFEFSSIVPILTEEEKRQEIERVQSSPNKKSPIGTMPDTTHEKDHEDVSDSNGP